MKAKKNTPEKDRGEQFLKTLKMWKILHEDNGKTVFNKNRLAKVYFGITVIRESHKRYVQRLMTPLVKAGIAKVTDKNGQKPKELGKNEERWWKYGSCPLSSRKSSSRKS